MLATGSHKERAVGRPKDRRLDAEIRIIQIDMRALVDGHQCRRHCDVDVLASPGCRASMQCREDRDRRLQPGIDVCM